MSCCGGTPRIRGSTEAPINPSGATWPRIHSSVPMRISCVTCSTMPGHYVVGLPRNAHTTEPRARVRSLWLSQLRWRATASPARRRATATIRNRTTCRELPRTDAGEGAHQATSTRLTFSRHRRGCCTARHMGPGGEFVAIEDDGAALSRVQAARERASGVAAGVIALAVDRRFLRRFR